MISWYEFFCLFFLRNVPNGSFYPKSALCMDSLANFITSQEPCSQFRTPVLSHRSTYKLHHVTTIWSLFRVLSISKAPHLYSASFRNWNRNTSPEQSRAERRVQSSKEQENHELAAAATIAMGTQLTLLVVGELESCCGVWCGRLSNLRPD